MVKNPLYGIFLFFEFTCSYLPPVHPMSEDRSATFPFHLKCRSSGAECIVGFCPDEKNTN